MIPYRVYYCCIFVPTCITLRIWILLGDIFQNIISVLVIPEWVRLGSCTGLKCLLGNEIWLQVSPSCTSIMYVVKEVSAQFNTKCEKWISWSVVLRKSKLRCKCGPDLLKLLPVPELAARKAKRVFQICISDVKMHLFLAEHFCRQV